MKLAVPYLLFALLLTAFLMTAGARPAAAASAPYEPQHYNDLLRLKDILALADLIEAYHHKTHHYPLVAEPQEEMQLVSITGFHSASEPPSLTWEQLEQELAKELGTGIKLKFDPSEGKQGEELRIYQYATDGQDYYVSAMLAQEVFYARKMDDKHFLLELSSRPVRKDSQYKPLQLRHFLQKGPDDVDRQIALAAALAEKDFDGAKQAIEKGANLSPVCDFQTRCLPLADAAKAGELETIRFLLDNGADINAFTAFFDVALTSALAGKQNAAVQLLLEKGADVNIPNAFGTTPFIGALAAGDVEMAKLLLDKGGNPDRRFFAFNSDAKPGDTGDRPLEAAIMSRKPELVEMLLKAGADATLKGHAGATMLELARGTGNAKITSLIKTAPKK